MAVFFQLITFAAHSQDFTDLRNKLNNVFSPINKSQIPTGILDEYGYGLTEAQGIDATDTMHIDTWRGLYYSLFTARIYGTQLLPILDTVNTRMDTYTGTAIQIPAIHYQYGVMRSDAVSANLLRIQSGKLYDVAGRTQSPYLTKSVFGVALSQSYSNNGNVSFIVRSNLVFNNTGKTLAQIHIDAATGIGWQLMSLNTAFAVNYNSTGKKLIKIRFTYTDGTQVVSQSILDVLQVATTASLKRYEAGEGFEIPVVATVNHAGAVLRIVLSERNPTRTTTQRLMKPLIVVEGYDASGVAPALFPPYGYEEFRVAINRTNPFGYDFNFNLDDVAGYDLVFVNYNDGTDDIRRNAAMFQDVLRLVNFNKVNNPNNGNIREQNVVMGLSMGGLVTRYGLAQMEKNFRAGIPNNIHEVRLLITHDSPHRGANVPVGMQAPVRMLASSNILLQLIRPLREAVNLLNEPASEQMLIYRTIRNGKNNYTYVTNTFLDGEYRTMITFPDNTPAPYRFIATSNGSECGQLLLQPHSQLINASGGYFLNLIPFRTSRWRTELIINAIPNQTSTQRIFNFRIWHRSCLFGILCIESDLFNESANSTTALLPIDGAPGGTQSISTFLNNNTFVGFEWSFLWLINVQGGITVAPSFSFAPTVSALDVTNVNTNTLTQVYSNGISPTNPSRTANFIAQEPIGTLFNVAHLRFTARNSQWLFNEMENIANNNLNCSQNNACTPPVAILAQNGTSFCNSSTLNFSVPTIQGATYNWSVGNGLQIVGGQNTPNVQISRSGSGSGSSSVSLTIVTNCGNITPQALTIQLGAPPVGGTYSYSGYIYPVGPNNGIGVSNSSIYISLNHPLDPNTTYNWQIISQSSSGASANFNGKTATIYLSPGKYLNCICTVTTTCGTASASFNCYNYAFGGFSMLVYPNPSDEELSVEAISPIEEQPKTLQTGEDNALTPLIVPTNEEIELLDVRYQVQWKGRLKEGKAKIPTRHLPNGIYYLRIEGKDKKKHTRQILIRH